MKKQGFLLPLLTLLLSSCGTKIALEDMPELVKPKNLLSKFSMKAETTFFDYKATSLITLNGSMIIERSYDVYNNYVRGTNLAEYDLSENQNNWTYSISTTNHMFNSEGKTYNLQNYIFTSSSENETYKSGEFENQTTEEFLEFIIEGVNGIRDDLYWMAVEMAYESLLEVNFNGYQTYDFGDDFSFTKKGDVYSASFVGTKDDEEITFNYDLTIKDGVVTKLTEENFLKINNKKVFIVKAALNVTFVDELPTYNGSFPVLADYGL